LFGQLRDRSGRDRLIHPSTPSQFGNRGRRPVDRGNQEFLGNKRVALLQWHGASMTHYLFAESAAGHPKPRPHDLDDTVKIDEAQLGLAERRAPLNRHCSGD
jgi:hypothetical protein